MAGRGAEACDGAGAREEKKVAFLHRWLRQGIRRAVAAHVGGAGAKPWAVNGSFGSGSDGCRERLRRVARTREALEDFVTPGGPRELGSAPGRTVALGQF
jgi:hypothetical protein